MASVELHPTAFPDYMACRKLRAMAGPYLKQWRTHKGLTQKEVVDRLSMFDDELLPTTEASLSRVENGKQIWTQRIIEALAHVYGIESDDLHSRDPIAEKERAKALAEGANVTSIEDFRCMSEKEQQRVIRMWNAIRDAG